MGIVGILLLIAVLYVLAVMPRVDKRPDCSALKGWYYAHRGLHDNKTDAPENSMAAFQKAVDGGYGIELDVQLTKDKIPVVFHDGSLKRVCSAEGNVSDYTYEELQQFHLCQSQERIPLLADVLKLVDGRVPLIIEIKRHPKASEVCEIADRLIREYQGVYCVESFDPFVVKWYKDHRPEVIRGQLSTAFGSKGNPEKPDRFLVHYLLANFLCKPDFIAYDHHHKHNLSRHLACDLYQALSVAWTIRSQEELDAARDCFELFIFEGFLPNEDPV
ncbi:MAG: glycerophosphodiester phosphodiesterase [Lachnospiraceae bacterium]|nr:glycerophosphodiester phosphodiesterase [Lachnospiraceae bacterium]